jgi:flagellum-specific peptidoglycan hydrolase FlgJ
MRKLQFIITLFLVALEQNALERIRVLYKQAKLETGNFTSSLFLNHNNAFGMRAPNSRKLYSSIHTGGNGRFASYDDVYSSILDRILLDKQNRIEYLNEEQYMVDVLNKGYTTNPNSYMLAWEDMDISDLDNTIIVILTSTVLLVSNA